MATNAVERQSALNTNWLRLLAPNPERLEFAARIALICALTTLVTEIYQTPYAALAPSRMTCAGGLSSRIRTGNRCSTRTQLSERST